MSFSTLKMSNYPSLPSSAFRPWISSDGHFPEGNFPPSTAHPFLPISSSRKNGVALVNIPVLGEEDLITQGGNDRLDQMREARGGPSNNLIGHSPANNYFFQHLGIAQQPNQQAYEMVFHNDIHQVERHVFFSFISSFFGVLIEFYWILQ